MNAQTRLNEIKELSRLRSQKYYNNNKALVSVRRKAQRTPEDKTIESKIMKLINKPKPDETPKESKLMKLINNQAKPDDTPKESKLMKLINNQAKPDETPKESKLLNVVKKQADATKSFYENTFKTLCKILDSDDITTMFKKYNEVIKIINDATYNNKLYSVNSKKGFYQTILFLNGDGQFKISKKAYDEYNKQFELLKITSKQQSEDNQAKEQIMTFNEYLNKIKNEYGEDSKEYLISSLYSIYGFRDDLINLKIIPYEKEATDTTKNYIVIPSTKTKNCVIIMNAYKTSSKYGQDKITIPTEQSNLIKDYKKNNLLKFHEALFGEKPLSGFIKKFNNKIGLNITINTLRQMQVSETLNKNGDAETRLNLSSMMKHSPETSKKYNRQIINI